VADYARIISASACCIITSAKEVNVIVVVCLSVCLSVH